MAIIESGTTTPANLIIEPNSGAMRVTKYNTAGTEIIPSANQFMGIGQSGSAVGASLAGDSILVALRNGATRTMYITQLSLQFCVAVLGTSALVPGVIAWRRFDTAAPTGGTNRIPTPRNQVHTSAYADFRDNNSALTIGSANFPATGIIASTNIPVMLLTGSNGEWHLRFDQQPIVVPANGGIALRTLTAMPGTQTWVYSYMIAWYEI